MNGISLFSGIAGLDLAISPFTTTRLYCDSNKVCQAILQKRMQTGDLQKAPIHEDVQTLDRAALRKYIGNQRIDIVTAGFPFEYSLHSCLQTLPCSLVACRRSTTK
jgi:site-specific DNA-cytosine methylase